MEDRFTITRLHEDGQSIIKIATTMNRAASSISREMRRNPRLHTIGYQPAYADALDWSCRRQGSRM
jgi:IS30 family transposase